MISEEVVECRPEKIPNGVLDKDVDVHLVQRFFSHDAWLLVEDVIKRKEEINVWTCSVCFHTIAEGIAIVCESCLEWFHLNCVGLVTPPKCKDWFCRQCYANVAA